MSTTKYWTWHMLAELVILFLLGLHMTIMHTGLLHVFAPYSSDTANVKNSLFRDGKLFFTVTYIVLLGVALYHGLYGLRTMLFELTLKPAIERTVSVLLLALGLGFFALGTWAAIVAHGIALAGGRG